MSGDAVTNQLIIRAHSIFKRWGWTLPTGADGLTRRELRALANRKIVTGVLKKLPSGSIINVWKWEGPK